MKKVVALCMSAILMTSSVFASFPDVSDTFWGKDVITKWSDLEIVKGDNSGNFRPNDNITRAEFSVILNKLMKYNKATENQFEDVKSSDWFYEDIGALAQAGVMAGTEGNALPKQNITRQDAVVLMAKAFNIAPIDNEYGFSDSKEISSYAKGYVNAMAKLGYIQGRENNTFCPKTNLTRTEALAIADKLVAKLVNKEGTYTENIEGNMLINVADVTLKDTEIKGNLYIAEGVGDGEIYINNTKIEGDLIVEGGGNNSIYIVDSNVEGKLHLNKRDGNVRVKASGETNIEKAVIANGATLDIAEVTGEGIKNVELSETLTNENTVKLVGEFKTVESKAENVVVEVEGKIETVKLEKPATIEGDVEITKTEVAEGIEANIKGEVVDSNREIKTEEKKEEKEESSSSGGGSSSGGSSSSSKIEIPELVLTDIANGGKIDLGENYSKYQIGYVNDDNSARGWYQAAGNRYLTEGSQRSPENWDNTVKIVKVKYNNIEKSVRIRPDKPSFNINKLNGTVELEDKDITKYEYRRVYVDEEYKNLESNVISIKDGDDYDINIREKATDQLLESTPFEVTMFYGVVLGVSDNLVFEDTDISYRNVVIKANGAEREFRIIAKNTEDKYISKVGEGKNLETFDIEPGDTVTIYKTYDECFNGLSYAYRQIFIDNIVLEEKFPELVLTDIANGGKIDLGENYSKLQVKYKDSYYDSYSQWYMPSTRYLTNNIGSEINMTSGWYDEAKEVVIEYNGTEKSLRIRPDKPSFTINKLNGTVELGDIDLTKYEYSRIERYDERVYQDLESNVISIKDGETATLYIREKATDKLLESVPFRIKIIEGKISKISEIITDSNHECREMEVVTSDGRGRNYEIIKANQEDKYLAREGEGKNFDELDLRIDDTVTIFDIYRDDTTVSNIILEERGIARGFAIVSKAESIDDKWTLRMLDTETGCKIGNVVVDGDITSTSGAEVTELKVGDFIMYSYGENISNVEVKLIDSDVDDLVTIANVSYSVIKGEQTSNYDRERIADKDFTSDSIIVNRGGSAETEMEIVHDGFKMIVGRDDSNILTENSYIIYDEDEDIKLIVLDGSKSYLSQYEYAFVIEAKMYEDDAFQVTLYNDGQEMVYETNDINLTFDENDFIKYKVTDGGKLDVAKSKSIIKVEELNLLADNVDLTECIEIDELLLDRTAIAYDLTKEHITVDEPKATRITFDEISNKNGVGEILDSIRFEVDDEVFTGIIYDLTDIEEPQMVTDIADIEGKAVLAIDLDEDDRADIFVMLEKR